jgi:hypothetical protein
MWNSLPSRRGIASSKAGKAAQFVDHFLRALQVRGWQKSHRTYEDHNGYRESL